MLDCSGVKSIMWQAKQSGAVGLQAVHLVGWADDDYVCARKLLLDGFLIQGAVLSNTAIEKYLKAVVRVRGLKFKRTHDVVQLYEQLKGNGFAPLHEGYLRILRKTYKMRYPDDLEPNFNVGLCQSQMLAELDASVFAIRSGFRFVVDHLNLHFFERSPEI